MATTPPPVSTADGYHGAPERADGTYANGPDFGAYRPGSYLMNSSIQPTEFSVRNSTIAPVADGSAAQPNPSRFHEEMTASRRGSSSVADSHIHSHHAADDPPRADSQMSTSHSILPSRSNTLKKKASLSRKGSLRRSSSRRSSRAGSVRSVNLGEREKYGASEDEANSAFYVPIPTHGTPTEILANRFQAWRKVLKDLIAVFRDIQKSYETRSKVLLSVSNSMNSISIPSTFLMSGGIADATSILKDYHRRALLESNKAKEVETEIIVQLSGLRNDLQQKVKEIKGLSGDFKNNVDKEVEATRKVVRNLGEALGLVDTDAAATSGKGDPYIIKIGVDRQLEKQLEEENYLHRAYLNLESSGRELESIVVGEIQKAYNAYASILKRDADAAFDAVEQLRDGPISMPKDHEWNAFLGQNDTLIDPSIPVRDVQAVTYPGKEHPAAAEVRSGMLERKSKYLKSYTPGWYVLSPTHLHEFKSADRISSQALVMSLYLPEQRLGSHSQPGSSSHKFILKGRQTGAMHRGHTWVFRAESHDTMMAWYEDLRNLTEKTGEARNAFVRRHARSFSGASHRTSIDSDRVLMEDDIDGVPYSSDQPLSSHRVDPASGDQQWNGSQRGRERLPNDVHVNRQSFQAPPSPTSMKSGDARHMYPSRVSTVIHHDDRLQTHPKADSASADGLPPLQRGKSLRSEIRQSSNYGDWMAPLPYDAQQQQQQPNGTDRRPHSISPLPTKKLSRTHSIARSTGAPVIVPDDQLYRTSELGPASVDGANIPRSLGTHSRQEDEGRGITIVDPLDPRDRAVSEAPIADGYPADRPLGAAPYVGPHRPWDIDRTPSHDIRVPGQYPVAQANYS